MIKFVYSLFSQETRAYQERLQEAINQDRVIEKAGKPNNQAVPFCLHSLIDSASSSAK